MTKLVFSYAHADETLRNELEKHLASLKRQGLIETWHDRRIVPGQNFAGAIESNFEQADIIILLISPDFINSDYCYEVEMRRAIERHDSGQAVVIPVILRMCHWHDLPFGKILAATVDGKPIQQFATLDEGFYQVVDAIKRVIKRPATAAAVSPTKAQSLGPEPISVTSARSSNLRIKRAFTDKDADQARTECFEYIAKYFENSLHELKHRNSATDYSFLRIDAKSFECAIYVSGVKECQCGIWIDTNRFGGDILYNQSGVVKNSYNESMSLKNDGYIQGFKPMGMGTFGQVDSLLSYEGVAEYFWEIFIKPLQK